MGYLTNGKQLAASYIYKIIHMCVYQWETQRRDRCVPIDMYWNRLNPPEIRRDGSNYVQFCWNDGRRCSRDVSLWTEQVTVGRGSLSLKWLHPTDLFTCAIDAFARAGTFIMTMKLHNCTLQSEHITTEYRWCYDEMFEWWIPNCFSFPNGSSFHSWSSPRLYP